MLATILLVNARLGGQQRNGEIDAAVGQIPVDGDDPLQVLLKIRLFIRIRTELLFGEEPAVLADDQAVTPFAQQLVARRGPQVLADLPQRKRLIEMALESLRRIAIGPAHLLGELEGGGGHHRPGTDQKGERHDEDNGNPGIG